MTNRHVQTWSVPIAYRESNRMMKGELEDLGEETDENVENLSKMQGQVLNMTKGHVNIFEDDGSFKSTYDIMKGIAEVWDDITDVDRAELAETVAGKHRANQFIALIDNFEAAEAAKNSALNSDGSAEQEYEKYLESLQAHIDKLQTSWQALSNATLSTGFLNGAIDAIIALVDALTVLIDTFGVIPTIAATVAAALSFKGVGFAILDKEVNKIKIFGQTLDQLSDKIKRFQRGSKDGGGISGGINNMFDGQFKQTWTGYENQIKKDTQCINEFKNAINSGVAPAEALKRTMVGASESMRQFAESMDFELLRSDLHALDGEINKMTSSQKNMAVAAMASNKSFSNVKGLLDEYNTGCKNVKMGQQEFVSAVGQGNNVLGKYMKTVGSGKATMSGYITSLIGAKVATIGLEVASMALNAALTMGIGVAISAIVTAIMDWINAEEKLAEEVEEVTNAYKDQRDTLNANKQDFEDMAKRYQELTSAGQVDSLGNNVSLSTSEYEELLDLRNQIAEQIPSLVQGYDAEGNAILSVASSAQELNDAYNKLIAENNDELLANDKTIFQDFEHDMDELKSTMQMSDTLEGFLNSEDIDKAVSDYSGDLKRIYSALLKDGLIDTTSGLTMEEAVADAIRTNRDGVQNVVNDFNAEVDAATAEMQEIASAWLSNAFLPLEGNKYGDYAHLSDTMQDIATQAIKNLDYTQFADNAEGMYRELENIMSSFDNLSAVDTSAIESLFDLQTKFNEGSITVGEYASAIEKARSSIGLLDEEVQKEIYTKLGVEFDENDIAKSVEDVALTAQKTLETNLKAAKIDDSLISEFIGTLDGKEIEIAATLDTSDWNGAQTIDELQQALDLAVALNDVEDINITTQTEGLEALNTALAESRSATGLTADSIDALESRYKDLEGYDAAALFEKTANGIHLNNEELRKLESQYTAIQKLNVDKNINALLTEYKNLQKQIALCTDEAEKAELQAEADTYADRIEELSTLAAQYEGLTSAFNEWQAAQDGAEEGDNYDSVVENLESIKELYDGGLVGTEKFRTSAQLMTNEDLSTASAEEIVAAYEKGMPKMQRYFTEGQEGCQNFLKDVEALGKGWAEFNEETGEWTFDFGNDKDLAEELGLNVDTIQQIIRKLNDYGFEIELTSDYSSLDDMQTKVEESEAKLAELNEQPVDINIDIEANAENIGKIDSEIENAKNKISEINSSSVSPDVKTAQLEDARNKLEILIQKKQEASQPAFMTLDTTQVNASLVDALGKVQEYQNALNNLDMLNELKAAGIQIDDSEIKAAEEAANNAATAIQALDGEVKVQIGLEEDGSLKSIEESFTSGKVVIEADTEQAKTEIGKIGDDAVTIDVETSGNDALDRLNESITKLEENKDIEINVTINGLEEVQELNKNVDLATTIDGNVDQLSKYVEGAKALSELGDNIESEVTARVKGNVIETPEYQLNNIRVFSDNSKDLKDIGIVESEVSANVEGNVIETPEYMINNLKVFSDSAEDLKNIGTFTSSVTANVNGNATETPEYKINNLKTLSDSAKDLKEIGTVKSEVTANIEGDVIDTYEYKIDNLKAFSDSAKDLRSIGTVESSVTANVDGDVIDTYEYKIDNLKTFTDSAKDVASIGVVESSVTANVDGDVIDTFEYKIDNLKTFSESAKDVASIGEVTSSVTANVNGNVTGLFTTEGQIDNLKVYSDSAKDVAGVGIVESSVTANTYGNVTGLFTTEGQIDNLKAYAESAKDVGSIGTVESSVTANVLGNVTGMFTTEEQIDNLKTYVESAKGVSGVGTVTSSVTANTYGNVTGLFSDESKIDNLEVYADSAKKLSGVGTVTTSVTANTYGNVTGEAESTLNNLEKYATTSKSVGNSTYTSSVTANINGNFTDESISRLESLSSVLAGLSPNQTVTINVAANVDAANIDTAISKLTTLSTSGVFKDYNATVSVGAKIATIDDSVVQAYTAPEKDGKAIYTVDSTAVDNWPAPTKDGTVYYSPNTWKIDQHNFDKTATVTYTASGDTGADGTAHANGTAFAGGTVGGRAFKQGDWGTKGSGVALGGKIICHTAWRQAA